LCCLKQTNKQTNKPYEERGPKGAKIKQNRDVAVNSFTDWGRCWQRFWGCALVSELQSAHRKSS